MLKNKMKKVVFINALVVLGFLVVGGFNTAVGSTSPLDGMQYQSRSIGSEVPPSLLPDSKRDCICIDVVSPVCGVDNKTYNNTCRARCAGVDVKHKGECRDIPPPPPPPPPPEISCLELIPGHNNVNEDRVNIVIIGFDYPDENIFKNRAVELVHINGDGSPNDSGLLSDPVFRNYQTKFNLWYVDRVLPFNSPTLEEDTDFLFSHCAHNNRRQEFRFIKDHPHSYASVREGIPGFTLGDNFNFNIKTIRNIVLHEFGHSFGGLYDEYAYSGHLASDDVPERINCDVTSSELACSKWCSGPPVLSLEQLKAGECEEALDAGSCHIKKRENIPCSWLGDNPILGQSGCVNLVNVCTPITDRDTCKASTSDFWIGTFCKWRNTIDPYFESQCIPVRTSSINLGSNCVADTGCYQSCSYSSWYRSSERSKMKTANHPWGYINERHLTGLLENIGLTGGGEVSSRGVSNVIFYDDFDKDGNIEGGAHCLE